ncbi:MAG: hypothetical protein NVSMB52_00390 [Chloroflexota bacterium]
MSTDATGLHTEGGAMVSRGLDIAADAVSTAGARGIYSLDDRLTLLSVRMTYVALSFFFACFYFAHIYLQLINANSLWLPKGINHPSIALGVLETGLILVAGLVYFWGQWSGLYARNAGRLKLGLWIAAALAIVSFILHVAELHKPGFSLQGGGYVSVFIALEGTFTVFLFFVSLALLGMANRGRLGRFERSGIAIEAFGEFFGWFCAIALMNFLVLYVQPFFPIAG